MQLVYEYDPELMAITEHPDGGDTEFRIRLLQEGAGQNRMKQVQRFFEDDDVITDVMFYHYPHHEYRVIVRQGHYAVFIMELMKHRLLRSVRWEC